MVESPETTRLVDRAIQVIQKHVPKFQIAPRSNNWFRRLLGKIGGTAGYWTTIGYTAYYPEDMDAKWSVIFHEGLHALRAKRMTLALFGFLYAFPISLAPIFLALGAYLWSGWSIAAFMGAILCFAPRTAYFRFLFELEGYEMNMALDTWMHGKEFALSDDALVFYDDQLSGPAYDWPTTRSLAERSVDAIADEIEGPDGYDDTEFYGHWPLKFKQDDPYYRDVLQFVRDNGLLHESLRD